VGETDDVAVTVAAPSLGKIAAALAVGIIASLFLLSAPPDMVRSGFALRGVFAGVACGLLFERRHWLFAVATAFAGSTVTAVLALLWVAQSQSGMPPSWIGLDAVAVAVLTAAVIAGGVAWAFPRTETARISLVVGTLTFALAFSFGWLGGPTASVLDQTQVTARAVPQAEAYGADSLIFLATVEHMRDGMAYYPAFQKAWNEDQRLPSTALPSAFNFREPFLFALWKYLPGQSAGTTVLGAFMALAWAGVMLTWLTARRFVDDGVAMLAGLAMVPVYVFAAFSNVFSFAEIWSAVFIIGALCLLVRERFLASAVVLALAVATRELAVVYIPVWAVAWWLVGERRSQWAPGLAVAVLGPIALIGGHVAAAPAAGSGPSILQTVGAYMNSPGISRTLKAIEYGVVIPFFQYVIPVFVLASVAGPLLVRKAWARWTLLTAAVLPLVLLTVFSQTEWDYYWGFNFQPPVFALAALVFVRVFPSDWMGTQGD